MGISISFAQGNHSSLISTRTPWKQHIGSIVWKYFLKLNGYLKLHFTKEKWALYNHSDFPSVLGFRLIYDPIHQSYNLISAVAEKADANEIENAEVCKDAREIAIAVISGSADLLWRKGKGKEMSARNAVAVWQVIISALNRSPPPAASHCTCGVTLAESVCKAFAILSLPQKRRDVQKCVKGTLC